MIVKLKSVQPADLTPGQCYVVIGVEADDYRLLNDQVEANCNAPVVLEIVNPARIPPGKTFPWHLFGEMLF